jgi:hypothetical protein
MELVSRYAHSRFAAWWPMYRKCIAQLEGPVTIATTEFHYVARSVPRSDEMRKTLAIATIMLAAASSQVQAQTDLTAYADANGYIDVQALTCAALAGTWQGDADRLTTWYSGWYNGLAKKHYFNIARSKELEHEVIVYCKANRHVRIIEAIGAMLKQERLMSGFK